VSLINDALKKVQSGGEPPGAPVSASPAGQPQGQPQPSQKSLLAQGILMGGVILILLAIIMVLLLLPLLRGGKTSETSVPPAAVAPVSPAAGTASSKPAIKLAPVDEDLPEVAGELERVAALQAAATDSAAEVNHVMDAAPASTPAAAPAANAEPVATAPVPLLSIPAAPDPKIVEYVNAIEVCGASGEQVLLKLPGRDEAAGYREGDILDGPFEIAVFKITERRLILIDAEGHKFNKSL